jgi:hypothetical protein
LRHIVCFLTLTLLLATCYAQTAQRGTAHRLGTIGGAVTDQNGKAIPGAKVTLSGKSGSFDATSDDQGNYAVKGLAAGTYDMSVSADGYKPFELPGIMLGAGKELPVDATLDPIPGAQPATAAPAVETPQAPAEGGAQQAPAGQEAPAGAPLVAPTVALPTLAGEGGSAIVGTATDNSGAVIPDASVSVTGPDGVTKVFKTGAQGNYIAGGLKPGAYKVTISATGFKDFEAAGVNVAQNATQRLDAVMQPAVEKQEVKVEGEKVAQVETETAQVEGTITQKEVVKIGLNGRNFTQLIALAPGVSNQTGQDEAKVGVTGSVKYSVNGGRVEYNTFNVDGADLLNTGIAGSDSTLIVYPSLDAIQEVKVLTSNYGAMYGRTASGTVLVNTKSGTSAFHGNGYEFIRNEFFNARNYFDIGRKAPLYRRNDFGYTLGGPIFIPNTYNQNKDKTFFFFSQEFRYEKTPIQYNQAVPSLAERSGDFSDVCPLNGAPTFLRSQFPDCPAAAGQDATGKLPTFQGNNLNGQGSSVNRNAAAILNSGIIPLPNAVGGCNSSINSCYDVTVSPPTTWREELLRLDHNIDPKLKLMFRYIHDSWDTTITTPQWAFIHNSFPTVENDFNGPGTSIVLRLTQTLSTTLLNDTYFSYGNSHITLNNVAGPGANLARPAILDAPCDGDQCPMGFIFNNGFGGKMPGVVVGGNNLAYGGNGFAVDSAYMPWDHTNPTYSFGDTVSKAWGKHTLQFGADVTFWQRNQTNGVIGATTGDVQGLLTFSNVGGGPGDTGNAFANFLWHGVGNGGANGLGAIQSFLQDSTQSRYYQRYQMAEPYVQDDWRVTNRLTLNLGLRISLFGTYYEKYNNIYNWSTGAVDPGLSSQVKVDGTGYLVDCSTNKNCKNGVPIFINLSNLDPRITNGLVRCGTNGTPRSCMQGHLFNPAPRVGFAWDPTGSGKTSIRGGYGIFFEHGTAQESNTGSLEGSSPTVLTMQKNFPTDWSCIGIEVTDCTDTTQPRAAYPLNVTNIPSKAVWPYVQQWSFSVQRELPKSMVATVAYVGSKGTHLTIERQLNQLLPVPASSNSGIVLNGNPFGPNEPLLPAVTSQAGDCNFFTGSSFTLLNGTVVTKDQPAFVNLEAACFGQKVSNLSTPDPNTLRTYAYGFGRVYSLQNVANASYNALQATLRRVAGPLTLGVSYTYSHSIDNASDRTDTTFVNSYDLAANRASSNFDQRHLLSISYVYQVPAIHGLTRKMSDWAHGGDAPADENPKPATDEKNIVDRLLESWEISGVTIFQSGTPFSVLNGGGGTGVSVLDNAGVANGVGAGSYPDVVANPKSPAPPGGDNSKSFGPLLLNPAAFVAPRGLTFGNAGRNFLNNPNRLNFDIAILRHFKTSEKTDLEFRWEIFNLFNTTQFRIYDPNLGNTGSNTISCYGPGAYSISSGGSPTLISGHNLNGSDYSAAGGSNIVTTFTGGVPTATTVNVDCLTGSSFLHPVNAHRPRTMQFGLKFTF